MPAAPTSLCSTRFRKITSASTATSSKTACSSTTPAPASPSFGPTRAELAALSDAGGSDLALLDALSQDYIGFYGHLLEDGMLVHDTCACVALVRPELFETVRGAVRVVCGGIAD